MGALPQPRIREIRAICREPRRCVAARPAPGSDQALDAAKGAVKRSDDAGRQGHRPPRDARGGRPDGRRLTGDGLPGREWQPEGEPGGAASRGGGDRSPRLRSEPCRAKPGDPVGVGNPDSRSDSPGTIGRCGPSTTSSSAPSSVSSSAPDGLNQTTAPRTLRSSSSAISFGCCSARCRTRVRPRRAGQGDGP